MVLVTNSKGAEARDWECWVFSGLLPDLKTKAEAPAKQLLPVTIKAKE